MYLLFFLHYKSLYCNKKNEDLLEVKRISLEKLVFQEKSELSKQTNLHIRRDHPKNIY